MAEEPKRLVEVRLIAYVIVDLRHPDLQRAITDTGAASSVPHVVAAQLSRYLESLPFITAAMVCRL